MRPPNSSLSRNDGEPHVWTLRYRERMNTVRKTSTIRVARGGGSLSPKTAKIVSSVTKRAGKSAATIRQKHAG